jgi:2-polyprenyl-3-methyl-5-hydroxy-6-metoxy-1,4-benzoquinol methylase
MFPEFYNRKYKKPYSAAAGKFICDDRVVEIIGDIPRFVNEDSYASLFCDQWKQYKKTQLDSYSGSPISENRLNRCLGDLQDNLQGKLVLEAGCGAGRFTEILLKKGARLVSADLSSAVEVNIENFPVSGNHIVIQADINDMPYSDETFDVVVCLGVIQHTPSPEQTIESLYKLVKKGGSLVIDHYNFTRSSFFRLASVYRWFLRKKSSAYTIPYTKKLVKRYLPLHKKVSGSRFLTMLLNRVSPVATYYRAFPQLNDQQQEEWALLDTHDGLTDWYKHLRSRKQIVNILNKLRAVDISCTYGGNGVEARCKKSF